MFKVCVKFANGEKFVKEYADFDTAYAVYNELTEFGGYRKAEIREDGEWIDFDEYVEDYEDEIAGDYSECGFDPYCGCYTYDC